VCEVAETTNQVEYINEQQANIVLLYFSTCNNRTYPNYMAFLLLLLLAVLDTYSAAKSIAGRLWNVKLIDISPRTLFNSAFNSLLF
jgi:hypothetical protein